MNKKDSIAHSRECIKKITGSADENFLLQIFQNYKNNAGRLNYEDFLCNLQFFFECTYLSALGEPCKFKNLREATDHCYNIIGHANGTKIFEAVDKHSPYT
jgi:hypothetical protein